MNRPPVTEWATDVGHLDPGAHRVAEVADLEREALVATPTSAQKGLMR